MAIYTVEITSRIAENILQSFEEQRIQSNMVVDGFIELLVGWIESDKSESDVILGSEKDGDDGETV